MKQVFVGLALGLAAGLVDCGIYTMMSGGEGITLPMILGGSLFWTGVGLAIHSVRVSGPGWIKGSVLSLFFTLPWMIEFGWTQNQPSILPVMAGLALGIGALLGLSSDFFYKRTA